MKAHSALVFLKPNSTATFSDALLSVHGSEVTIGWGCVVDVDSKIVSIKTQVRVGNHTEYKEIGTIDRHDVEKVMCHTGRQIWPETDNLGDHDAPNAV